MKDPETRFKMQQSYCNCTEPNIQKRMFNHHLQNDGTGETKENMITYFFCSKCHKAPKP